jgi:integrase
MSRRGRFEGAVYQRGDGRWVAAVSLGQQGGKRARRVVYGATRREAQAKLKELVRDHDAGLLLGSDRQPAGEYLEQWIRTVKHSLRATTHTRYAGLLRLHAIPQLGPVPLGDVTPQHLERLYADRLARTPRPLSPRSVRHLHMVLHRAFRHAVRLRLIGRNPADAVDAPRPDRHPIRAMSREDAQALLRAAQGHDMETLIVMALQTGMRQGELLALRWQDVDWSAGRVQVLHTLQRLPRRWSIEAPKTNASRRSIVLAPSTLALLRAHRTRQLEQRLAVGSEWRDHGFVFTRPDGEPLDGRALGRDTGFRGIVERAGLPPMRWHDLRHAAATLLLSANVHPKVVQDMLGHSTIAITLDTYSHVVPRLQEQAASTMEALLTSALEAEAGG